MKSISAIVALTGATMIASAIALAVTKTPLGSPLFLGLAALMAVAYIGMLARVWNETETPRRLLVAAFGLAVAMRAPLAIPPVDANNDMVRYQWDGRVQRLGYNPYLVVPSDPAMAGTHTDDTRQMPSSRARTPYPPAAELFFRLVVTIHDSSRAMKLALVGCDLLTMIVLWRWLVVTGRNEWLTLAYGWHPLVVLEVAYSGHVDALGALWICATAYWLARRRTALASIAFVMAVATKLLPIVLAPLLWGRVRRHDMAIGGLLLILLVLPFTDRGTLPLGAVPNMVAHIRFNGPIFRELAAAASPQAAALAAVALGIALALWARWRWHESDPAAWAWPMAVALACAPVVYPWYLLYLTPFLFTVSTLPLTVWTVAAIPTYLVWDIARHGGPWRVPPAVMLVEYGLPVAIGLGLWGIRRFSRPVKTDGLDVKG